MGLMHGGEEFLKGSLLRIEKFAIFWRRKFLSGRICVSFEFISLNLQSLRFEVKRKLGLRVIYVTR